jgi:hypothetical protein
MAKITVTTKTRGVIFEINVDEWDVTKPIARQTIGQFICQEIIKAQEFERIDAQNEDYSGIPVK